MLAWLAGLVFPACAFAGAAGLPPAVPLDPTTLARPATPNAALAAAPGATPLVPEITLSPYAVPPERLRAALLRVAASEERVFPHGESGDQLDFVARSRLFNFPDLVTAWVLPAPAGAQLVLWSRSIYGRSDLGANQARLARWVAALERELTR